MKVADATLATEEQLPLLDELWNHAAKETAMGGSALNSARGTAYALKKNGDGGIVHYVGAIGKDAIA